MVSISPRWLSVKLCADAGGAPQSANISSAGARKRNEGMDQSSRVEAGFLSEPQYTSFM
jgi:hypothetical protein